MTIKINLRKILMNIHTKGFIFITVFYTFYLSIINLLHIPDFLNYFIILVICVAAYSFGQARIYIKDFFVFLCLLVIVLINILMFRVPVNTIVINFLFFLLMIVFSGSIDIEKYQNTICNIAYVYSLVLFVYKIFFYRTNASSDYIDDMGFAYYIIPSFAIVTYNFFRDKRIVQLIFLIADVVYLLTCGTRGPILCCILYVTFCILMERKNKKNKKNGVIFLVILGISLLVINANYIVEWVYPIFQRSGFSTRWIRFLRRDFDVLSTSGRDNIYSAMIRRINMHPIIGGGLMEERSELGGYAHNLILEVLNTFGIPLGAILLMALFFLVIYSFVKTKSVTYKYYIVAFFCVSFVKLMFSSSFIQESSLFVLIGICLSSLRHKNEVGISNYP